MYYIAVFVLFYVYIFSSLLVKKKLCSLIFLHADIHQDPNVHVVPSSNDIFLQTFGVKHVLSDVYMMTFVIKHVLSDIYVPTFVIYIYMSKKYSTQLFLNNTPIVSYDGRYLRITNNDY